MGELDNLAREKMLREKNKNPRRGGGEVMTFSLMLDLYFDDREN